MPPGRRLRANVRPGRCPCAVPPNIPAPTLVNAVQRPKTTAAGSTGSKLAGSISSPKKKKKVAAKRSRSGASKRCDCSAMGPEIAVPTRNAPIAADTCNRCMRPATNNTAPSTESRITSSDWCAAAASPTMAMPSSINSQEMSLGMRSFRTLGWCRLAFGCYRPVRRCRLSVRRCRPAAHWQPPAAHSESSLARCGCGPWIRR